MNNAVASLIVDSCSKQDIISKDLSRLRSVTIASIFHEGNTLTVIDIAGTDKLNSFCKLNDGTSASLTNQGLLAGFVFDLVPMDNAKYILHLHQGGDAEEITALLNMFGSYQKAKDLAALSDAGRSSSPSVSETPSYARPTKSSVTPRARHPSFQISKPRVSVSSVKPMKKLTSAKSKFLVDRYSSTVKERESHKALEDMKRQQHATMLELKQEITDLKSASSAILSQLLTAKGKITDLQQIHERTVLQHQAEFLEATRELESVQHENSNLKSSLLANEKAAQELKSRIQELQRSNEDSLKSVETTKQKLLEYKQMAEDLNANKLKLSEQIEILRRLESSLRDEQKVLSENLHNVQSRSHDNAHSLGEHIKELSSKVKEFEAGKANQLDLQRRMELEIAALKLTAAEDRQTIESLRTHQTRANELETTISQLQKELQDSKNLFNTGGISSANPIQSMNAHEDVAKIFGYSDNDLGNLSTTFSPITGFDAISQIDFSNSYKKPLLGVASSPNRVLRQSNIRFNAPPIGKLASSPVRKDGRSIENIENQ